MSDSEVERRMLVPIDQAPVTARMLQTIASTEFVPKAIRGNVPAMMAAIKTGQELGLGPMTSMRSIDVIDGNPTPSAELLNAMVRKAGHMLQPIEMTPEKVSLRACRRDDPSDPWRVTEEFTFTLTMEDMARVTYNSWEGSGDRRRKVEKRLIDKDVWKAYPQAMLWARVTSWACRVMFPDVTLKLGYLADERSPSADVHPPDPSAPAMTLDERGELVLEQAEPEEQTQDAEVIEPIETPEPEPIETPEPDADAAGVKALVEGTDGTIVFPDPADRFALLLSLVEVSAASGSKDAIHARLDDIVELMAQEGIWPEDALVKMLKVWPQVDSWTALTRSGKDAVVKFAAAVQEKAKKDIAKALKEEVVNG